MAVKIRLRQQGRTNRHTFRLVACESRTKRDGKYLAMLGWYDPCLEEKNAHVDEEKTVEWLQQGAVMTEDAQALIARVAPGVIKQWKEKQQAKKVKEAAKRRTARKAKAAQAAK